MLQQSSYAYKCITSVQIMHSSAPVLGRVPVNYAPEGMRVRHLISNTMLKIIE